VLTTCSNRSKYHVRFCAFAYVCSHYSLERPLKSHGRKLSNEQPNAVPRSPPILILKVPSTGLLLILTLNRNNIPRINNNLLIQPLLDIAILQPLPRGDPRLICIDLKNS
jgi:hypothetical protein